MLAHSCCLLWINHSGAEARARPLHTQLLSVGCALEVAVLLCQASQQGGQEARLPDEGAAQVMLSAVDLALAELCDLERVAKSRRGGAVSMQDYATFVDQAEGALKEFWQSAQQFPPASKPYLVAGLLQPGRLQQWFGCGVLDTTPGRRQAAAKQVVALLIVALTKEYLISEDGYGGKAGVLDATSAQATEVCFPFSLMCHTVCSSCITLVSRQMLVHDAHLDTLAALAHAEQPKPVHQLVPDDHRPARSCIAVVADLPS
jgi:hypothetical protein